MNQRSLWGSDFYFIIARSFLPMTHRVTLIWQVQFSSVIQLCPTLCDPMNRSTPGLPVQPHEPQHTRPPCPSPTPRVHPNPCPSSQWCHPIISFSIVTFSSCPQSFPASGSFPMSQLFTSGGQSIGVSASTISPSNENPGLISFRMDWLDLLAVQGTPKNLL